MQSNAVAEGLESQTSDSNDCPSEVDSDELPDYMGDEDGSDVDGANIENTKSHAAGETSAVKTEQGKKKRRKVKSARRKEKDAAYCAQRLKAQNSMSHQQREAKHRERQREREALANGTAVPPPGAGPNWAKLREVRLAKHAKATRVRHKRHSKRMTESKAAKDAGAEDGPRVAVASGPIVQSEE